MGVGIEIDDGEFVTKFLDEVEKEVKKEVEKEVEKTISGPDGPDGEAICAVEGPTEVHEPSAFTKGLEQALKNDKPKKIHETITMIQGNPFGWDEEMQKKTLAKYASAYGVTLPS